MRGLQAISAMALVACALAGCKQQSSGGAAAGKTLVVRTAMKQDVNPTAMAIWDIGNNALDDKGQIDPAKMDDGKWAALASEAAKLGDAARTMAAAQVLKAADPKDSAVGEGEVPMDKVQGRLDADPAGFRQHASAFAAHADKLAAAAKSKDGKVAGDLVSGLDGACEGCHTKFWDPGPQ